MAFLVGCGGQAPNLDPATIKYPPVEYSAKNVPIEDAEAALYNHVGTIVEKMSSTCSFPTRKWFLNDFANALFDYQSKTKLAHNVPNKWECTALAIDAMLKAKKDHFFTPGAPNTGLAVGVLGYLRAGDPNDGHAIIFALVKEGNKTNVVYMEPVTCKEVALTVEEEFNYSLFSLF